MKLRFPIFVLSLLVAGGLLVYGLFFYRVDVYKKRSPQDPPDIKRVVAVTLGELALTDAIAKERFQIDDTGFLTDMEQEAECFT